VIITWGQALKFVIIANRLAGALGYEVLIVILFLCTKEEMACLLLLKSTLKKVLIESLCLLKVLSDKEFILSLGSCQRYS
jgi:hypothetical protein